MINQNWIPNEKIGPFLKEDTFIFLFITYAVSLFLYKLFFKKISPKRHLNLKNRFYQTFIFIVLSFIISVFYWFLQKTNNDFFLNFKFSNLLGFSCLIFVTITSIKLAQIYIYLYLFFMNMKQGVPRLIANLFTVILTFILVTYLASEIFAIHLTTMLATSAVFSLVLGLALQDTLGNLFSGVAVQIGKPFSIGDWVQIDDGHEKILGQIQEITWRATFLTSFAEELIMIPNKTIAQAQIVIFPNGQSNVRHFQILRFNHNVDVDEVTYLITEELKNFKEVLQDPPPRILVMEITDSWITVKVFYSLIDYSLKYRIGDLILRKILILLSKNNIELAKSKINIQL